MNAWDLLFQIQLVVAPQIGYVAQYFEITSTKSIEGYAPLVSLILLTSNTLRLYYFIGKHYMLALLFQAIAGVLVHFGLLLKVLEVHVSQVVNGHQEDVLFGGAAPSPQLPFNAAIGEEDTAAKPAPDATAGTTEASPTTSSAEQGATVIAEEETNRSSSPVAAAFHRFMRLLFQLEDAIETRLLRQTPRNFAIKYAVSATVALVVALFYFLSIGRVWHGAHAVVGYLALGVESLLVVPQILRNARRRSTAGLSIILIVSWGVGDIIKVVYFAYKKQELPFILCGIFQTVTDIVVVAQVIYYRFYLRADGDANATEDAAPPAPQAASSPQ